MAVNKYFHRILFHQTTINHHQKAKGGMTFGGGEGKKLGERGNYWEGGISLEGAISKFSAGGERGLSPISPSRENSAIPETKLGQKTQQNYNRLNYKMNYKSVIIHKKVLQKVFHKC